ncbi:hypothetical protein B0H10DRAFT_1940870 [Mycena sp. CBHHK59/15]|nr:hypothetical protein B0H10DRAFT_1940870 [Mycena sp. CBHHK59/15]
MSISVSDISSCTSALMHEVGESTNAVHHIYEGGFLGVVLPAEGSEEHRIHENNTMAQEIQPRGSYMEWVAISQSVKRKRHGLGHRRQARKDIRPQAVVTAHEVQSVTTMPRAIAAVKLATKGARVVPEGKLPRWTRAGSWDSAATWRPREAKGNPIIHIHNP